jgi:hypothetical protein
MEPCLSSMSTTSFGIERKRKRERETGGEREDGKQSKQTWSNICSEIGTTPCHREVRESPVLMFAVSHLAAQAHSGDMD